ncbi:MAG: hypothetical protein AAB886_01190 [Patescibacteria group bacterium]
MAKIFLSFFVVVSFTMVSPSFAASVLNIETETGAMKDEAKAVTKSAESLISIANPLDTKFLFTAEPGSLVIYDMASDSHFFMVTGVGDSVVEISAENFGDGDFVVVNTTEPDGCTTLTLAECRAQSDYIGEQSLSIKFPSPIAEKVEVPAPETESSLLDKALGFFLGFIDVDDTATSTDTANTDSLASVISAVSDTASTTSDNSSVATSTEEQAATIVVSDTNAPSLTSPLSNEMTTSIVPEETPTTSSVTGDTNTNGTTTTTF